MRDVLTDYRNQSLKTTPDAFAADLTKNLGLTEAEIIARFGTLLGKPNASSVADLFTDEKGQLDQEAINLALSSVEQKAYACASGLDELAKKLLNLKEGDSEGFALDENGNRITEGGIEVRASGDETTIQEAQQLVASTQYNVNQSNPENEARRAELISSN
jgi:hypothetical protein